MSFDRPHRHQTDHLDDTHASPSVRRTGDRAGAGTITTRDLLARPTREPSPSSSDLATVQRKARDAQMAGQQEDFWSLIVGQAPEAAAPVPVQAVAAAGVAGPATALPHLATIQEAFGHHDVGGIRAHVGGAAAQAATAIGAQAYATGDAVAFGAAPDLHIAAHEAAHVVQQRAGVHLKGGVGEAGDRYERHADAVADRVVAGQSAVDLLDEFAPAGFTTAAVQRKEGDAPAPTDRAVTAMRGPSSASSALSAAYNDLDSAEFAARAVMREVDRGALSVPAACEQVASILLGTMRPMGMFLQARARVEAAKDDGLPWQSPTLSEEAHALELDGTNAAIRVNNVLRYAFLLEERHRTVSVVSGGWLTAGLRPDDEAAVTHLVYARNAVATIATHVGWQAPASRADADATRYADNACPTDGVKERGPEHCKADPVEREANLRKLGEAVNDAINDFGFACKPHLDTLDRLIAERKEHTDLMIGVLSDAIGVAIDLAAPGLGKIASAVVDQVVDRSVDAIKEQAHESDERTRTKSMLSDLIEAMRASLTDTRRYAGGLDDHQLTKAVSEIQKLNKGYFTARLDPMVAAYRAQVEPTGRQLSIKDGKAVGVPNGITTAKYQVVKVAMPNGVRFAQVSDTTRQVATDTWGESKTAHTYRFIRWVNPEFEPMLDDAPPVDLGAIDGIPLGALAPAPAADE